MTTRVTTRRILKWLASLFALVLAVGFIVPNFKADRYRSRIQSALASALGRQVEVGAVRFNLLTGPGFTVQDVTVAEDPALGFEPIAYVKNVVATPRILSLVTGHLAFSSLRLEDAHLNLARTDLPHGEYRWNLEPLLRPALITAFPNITIHNARINFKAANVKSVVYLLDSDLAIEPPSSSSSPWRFRFEGKPARTDRPARGSGLIRARGEWKPGSLDANLQLERSELGDVIAVLRGEDAGLHGLISGNARFLGPLSQVSIEGRLRIEELHGWDQGVPRGESWPLDLHGRWSAQAQQLELDARVAGKGSTPFAVHYLVEQYLTQPRWGASVTLTRFPAAPLVPLARHLGLPLSAGLEVGGTINGVVGYSVAAGYGGQARIEQASFQLPGSPPLAIAEAQVLIAQGVAHLQPARLVESGPQEAVVEADYTMATGAGRFRISARNLDVAALAGQLPAGTVPVLSDARSGAWSGTLQWVNSEWSGDMELLDLELPSPALSEPVSIESAQCHLANGELVVQKIHAHAGPVTFTGDYRYQPEAAHQHRFRIAAGAVNAASLEKLLLPTLRRSRSVLGVDLPFRKRPLPPWLAAWHAEGTVQFADLQTDLGTLPNLRARFEWDAARVLLTDMLSTNLAGHAVIDLRAPEPAYELNARIRNQEWKGGHITVDTAATLQGTGERLLSSLRATGTFTATAAEESVDQLTGRYSLAWAKPVPRLSLTAVRLQSSSDIYKGEGNLQEDGTVLLQLSNATRQARLAGPLTAEAPLRWLSP